MKRHELTEELLRLRRERDEANERWRQAEAHRVAMQRDLDAQEKRLTRYLNHNNDLWNAMAKLPGGLDVARGLK